MPNYVTAGKPATGGALHVGATTAQLPTATGTALTGFTALGYISEEGLTNTNTMTSEDKKAWGGDIVLSTQTEKPDKFTCTLIDALDINVLKEIYGASNVSGSLSAGIVVNANSKELPARAWVVDMVMRDGVAKRIVIPNGKISELGEIKYADNDTVGYQITITASPDGDGNTHYEYIKAPSTSGSGSGQ